MFFYTATFDFEIRYALYVVSGQRHFWDVGITFCNVPINPIAIPLFNKYGDGRHNDERVDGH